MRSLCPSASLQTGRGYITQRAHADLKKRMRFTSTMGFQEHNTAGTIGVPLDAGLLIEAIEATRLPAITPGPCTRAPAGRRPLVAVVRAVEVATNEWVCRLIVIARALYEEAYGLRPMSSVSVWLLGGLTCSLLLAEAPSARARAHSRRTGKANATARHDPAVQTFD